MLAPTPNQMCCPECQSRNTIRIFSRFAVLSAKSHPFDPHNYDEKEDTRLVLKDLEEKGKLKKLDKDDIKFYQDYVKCR